jgi:alpha-tubulin suppressor-like RCC1 family protein
MPAGLLILLVLFPAIVSLPAGASSQKYMAVSCDGDTAIALDESGNVWLWGLIYDDVGSQAYGESPGLYRQYIGDTYDRVQATPVQLPLNDVIAISGGSLALKKDGTVWSWGRNDHGQLGDGTNVSKSAPVQVKGLDDIIAISCENMNRLALKKDGAVWSWGYNGNGNLGDGTLIDRREPVQVNGLSNVTAIYGGAFAVKDDGTVWTWGDTILDVDESGKPIDYQIRGNPDKINCKPTPFQIPGITDVKAVDVASTFSVVFIKKDGTAWNWGYDLNGSLGDGTVIDSNPPFVVTPVRVKGLTDVKTVSAAYGWSMALKNDGTVWVWGYNNGGQFGNGRIYDIEAVPVEVPGLDNVIAIGGKDMHSIYLKKDGSVWASGNNHDGSIGYGPVDLDAIVLTPVKILGLGNESTILTITPEPTIQQISNNSRPTLSAITPSPVACPPAAGLRLSQLIAAMVLIVIIAGAAGYYFLLRKR